MRKLVVTTFMTLDGVMQAPGGPDEDRDGGFEYGGWSVGYWDERMGELALEIHLAAGAVLFGRRSYEILGGYWPTVGDDDPMAAKLNAPSTSQIVYSIDDMPPREKRSSIAGMPVLDTKPLAIAI